MRYYFTFLCLIPFYVGLVILTVLQWTLTVPLLSIPWLIFNEVTFKHFIKRNVDITKSYWKDFL